MVSASHSSESPLKSVDTAVADLRHGRPVVLTAENFPPQVILAAETADLDGLERLSVLTEPGAGLSLILPAGRAAALNLSVQQAGLVSLALPKDVTLSAIQSWIDPTETASTLPPAPKSPVLVLGAGSPAAAGVAAAKLAGLLPAILLGRLRETVLEDQTHLACVSRDQVLGYKQLAAQNLRKVGAAQLPLAEAENTRVVAFRPHGGGTEHLALIIGNPRLDLPVLTRIHSQCLTGDLLGSLRCDCGDQLRGAISAIAAAGGGVLLYLAQEGRGIGLVNKLRAYQLQERDIDTVDANLQLGFDEDERDYTAAAVILRDLGVGRIRLLTNNPHKVEALRQVGLEVTERVQHRFPANPHNQGYLDTKAKRAGHIL